MDDLFANSLNGLTPDLDKSLTNSPFINIQGIPAMPEEIGRVLDSEFENIFIMRPELKEETEHSCATIPIEPAKKPSLKRLNDLDGNILAVHFTHSDENKTALEKFFYKFFPKIRTKKIISDALSELTALSKVANELITKQIPYGEQDATYDDLTTYLRSASSIHSKLKGKI